MARRFRSESGTILLMDRGDFDYGWLDELTAWGVYFLTRLKEEAPIKQAAPHAIPKGSQIKSDEIIALAGNGRSLNPDWVLQCIVVLVPETSQQSVLLSNRLSFSRVALAAINRQRRQSQLLL